MGQLLNRAPAEGGESGPNNPEATWWCKLLARVVSAVGAVIALILSIFCFIDIIYPRCIGAGVLQMFAAFIILVFEAPVCCQFIDFTKPIANFAENRTYFQKALIYCILSIPPIAICFGLKTVFGSGLLFAAGVIYGLMALGKKADQNQMRNTATAQTAGRGDETGLITDTESRGSATDAAAGYVGQKAGQQVGQYASQQVGQYAGQQAGQYAGQQTGQYAGQYAQAQFTK